jgi:[ribosomal protein S5]-alanine N-acetyltransferase
MVWIAAMIETQSLLLRPLQDSDTDTLVRELNNFNISRHTGSIPNPYHLDDAIDYLRFANGLDAHSLAHAITLKSAPNALVGVISYEFSTEKNDAELGYWLSEPLWGQGLMSEAALAVSHHAFTTAKIPKLIACHQNENPVSSRILKKLGFVELGQSSSFSKAQGKDVIVTNLAITRERWLLKKKPQ